MPRTILKQKARPRPLVKSGGRERFFSVPFESAVTLSVRNLDEQRNK